MGMVTILVICLFDWMLYVPVNNNPGHVGTISGLPRLNQYKAADQVSCSMTKTATPPAASLALAPFDPQSNALPKVTELRQF